MKNRQILKNPFGRFERFSLVFVLSLLLSVSFLKGASNNGQADMNKTITLEMNAVELNQILNEIEIQTSYKFTYSTDKINPLAKASLNVNETPLKSALYGLFSPLQIDFKFYDKQTIVLNRSSELKTISGKVSDSSGSAIIGASVVEKGTINGTTTDVNGNYSLNVDEGKTIVYSFVGYNAKEMVVGSSSVINVVLTEGVDLAGVSIIGSRAKPRTDIERPVPVDIISAAELTKTGQQDIGQSLHYTAPSFSAVKFGINDLAPLVDPASLRGLAPDQTLLLVNGKRRHKVSFFSLNHGVGKGQLGNDINAIPSAAVKRVEILRDGAAAQYGSDAIAGVMNMQLNDSNEGGSIRMYAGTSLSRPTFDDLGNNSDLDGEEIYGDSTLSDGQTFSTALNFGSKWGEDGFVNTTVSYSHSEPSDRSGAYSHSSGWYTADQQAAAGLTDEQLQEINGINPDAAVLGTAENTNGGVFINAGKKINDNWDYYAFGGITKKEVVGGVFTRTPARSSRAELSIFPNGYNPEVPSELTDMMLVSGFKGDFGTDWGLDFSAGYGSNNLDLFSRNTINPSLGPDSPTQFYTGSLNVTQTVFNADLTKEVGNTSLAFGTEVRFESFQQSEGQVESWIAGDFANFISGFEFDSLGMVTDTIFSQRDVGSSGREGYSDRTDGEWFRNNIGVYAEFESDITEDFLFGGAVRFENYSDFGSDFSYKAVARYKVGELIGIRASYNRSFRAPSLAQLHYSNFSQIAFDDDGSSVVTPFLPVRDALAQSAFGITELNPETSTDLAAGITAKLSNEFTVTADFYTIALDDRIIVSGGIPADDFPEFAGAGYDEINIFTNAVNTTTTGFDLVANYKKIFGENNRLNLTFAANFNETTLTGEKDTNFDDIDFSNTDAFNIPAAFVGKETDLIDERDIIFLTNGIPNQKIILSGSYRIGHVSFLLRGTRFGSVIDSRETDADLVTGDSGFQEFSEKIVTDLSITGHLTNDLSLTVGANNLFDVYPDMLLSPNVRQEVIYSRRTNQFGTQGRFINFSLNYNW